ncbi:BQ5605_C011g06359 [Microbotryum silenes-dioicae]|uniref:BQ5605_C011g06359 protein n=1 Tax=Microbotryum silenes-dioicae TaxID=796604 RepID=A0A2X0NSQ7_9BASI|nr:BQ5605_C011g06359 [Microbotryum silenes-dioicae]
MVRTRSAAAKKKPNTNPTQTDTDTETDTIQTRTDSDTIQIQDTRTGTDTKIPLPQHERGPPTPTPAQPQEHQPERRQDQGTNTAMLSGTRDGPPHTDNVARRVKLELPTLNAGFKSRDVTRWLAGCEDAIESAEWNYGGKIAAVHLIREAGCKMEGEGADWYIDCHDKVKALKSWPEFAQEVKARFINEKTGLEAKHAFYNAHQTGTLSDFVATLIAARGQAGLIGGTQVISDELFKDHLLHRCDELLYLRATASPSFNVAKFTMNQLVAYLQSLWEAITLERATTGVRRMGLRNDQALHEGRCFHCDVHGHIAADCPSKPGTSLTPAPSRPTPGPQMVAAIREYQESGDSTAFVGISSDSEEDDARWLAFQTDKEDALRLESNLVPFTKSASEVLEVWRGFQAQVERQSGQKIKFVRSDNGGEFVNQLLGGEFKALGITHELAARYTPQQNGQAERANGSLFALVRAMLKDSGLPKKYWFYALEAAVFVSNRGPHPHLKGKTALEVFFGKQPDVSHLRAFGSTAYVLVPKAIRKKLDDHTVKGTFLGYSGEYNYKVRVEHGRSFKIVVSSDVTFSDKAPSIADSAVEPRIYEVEPIQEHELVHQLPFPGLEQIPALRPAPLPEAGLALRPALFPEAEVPALRPALFPKAEVPALRPALVPELGPAFRPAPAPLLRFQDMDDDDVAPPPLPAVGPLAEDAEVEEDPIDHRRKEAVEAIDSDDDDGPAERDQPLPPEDDTLCVVSTRSVYRHPPELIAMVSSRHTPLPKTFAEAMASSEAKHWMAASEKELGSFKLHKVFKLTRLPTGARALGYRWVFTRKEDAEGNIISYKARLVIQGFAQRLGIDYNETFAPVSSITTILFLIAISAALGLVLEQFDYDSAFLNGIMEEDVYMKPHWFRVQTERIKRCNSQAKKDY